MIVKLKIVSEFYFDVAEFGIGTISITQTGGVQYVDSQNVEKNADIMEMSPTNDTHSQLLLIFFLIHLFLFLDTLEPF